VVRHAAAGAGAAALAAGFAAAPAAAATRAAANPFVLTFLPWGGWPAYAGPNWQQFIRPGLEHFEAQNPGVKIAVGAPQGGNTSILTAILAGNGPDVFQDWVMPPYLEAGAALNLKPFLEQDNIPLSTWSPGQMRTMQTDTGIWALPTYVHCDAVAINLSLLDELGLRYPDPEWDYLEAEKLARAAVSTQGKTKVYGWCPAGWTPWAAEYAWPFHLWGGSIRDAAATTCTVDQPNAYKGLQWYMNLYWDKVLYPGGDYPTSAGSIYNTSGYISAFQEIGANSVPVQLRTWRNYIKWTYWPMPRFPGGQASFEADDFYMANSATKNVEATWAFMKFLTADPYWQRYNFHYLLRTPCMVSMWDEWIRTLEAASPVAVGKNLAAYKDAALHYAVAPRYFKYDDTTVEPILSNAINAIAARTTDLVTGLTQAAKQITAHERIAATSSASVAAQLARVATQVAAAEKAGGNYAFPAPSTTGAGAPPVRLPASAVTVKSGTYTIVGSGGFGFGGGHTDDALTFAGMPWTKATGTFTCRLVAISEVDGKPIGGNSKIGLMARGDLSTEATYVAVVVAPGKGTQVSSRPIPASVSGDRGQGQSPTPPGLIPSSAFVGSLSGSAANYLTRPIWLRLVRNITHWTPYASLDGKNWQLQAEILGMESTGVWIGLAVSPNGNAPHIRAVFDNVSFTPTTFVQIGQ
jgi:ABC-type glycerol-3-phosphate transport system substrate-binding protein